MAVTAKLAVPAPAPRKGGDAQGPSRATPIKGPAAKNPRFQSVIASVGATARTLRAHPSPEQKREETNAAKKQPDNAPKAQGQVNKLNKVEATPQEPVKLDFVGMLSDKIKEVAPRSYAEAKALSAKGAQAEALKSAAKAPIGEQVGKAKEGLSKANSAEAGAEGKVLAETPPPSGGRPRVAAPSTRGVAPPKREPPPVTRAGTAKKTDEKLKESGLEPDHLAKIKHRRTEKVLTARDKAIQEAGRAEVKYRGGEAAIQAGTEAGAQGAAGVATAMMAQTAAGSGVQVHGAQAEGASKLSKRLQDKISRIEGFCKSTETTVQEILDGITEQVETGFGAAVELRTEQLKQDAERAFTGFFNKLGKAVVDKLDGGETTRTIENQLFETFRSNLLGDAEILGLRVQRELNRARKTVLEGQKKVDDEIATCTDAEKAELDETVRDVKGRFKDLEGQIDSKATELADTMASLYARALTDAAKLVDEASKAADKLLDDFVGAVKDAVKFIEELANRLKAALKKGADAVKLILKDPVGFLGNLLSAVKGGVMNFVKNFKHWMMQGLAGWLFGALAEAGVEMPADLELKSLFKLAASVLGLSWANIRPKIVRVIGEPTMAALEATGELVKLGLSGDIGALWDHIKGDLSGLKSAIIDAIISFVAQRIILMAAQKLVTMTNPAGAVVEAIMTIARFIGFLVERASQIVSFIEAVLNSVHAIATGAIGGAIAAIEGALGKAVPLVISLFASMVGLGGISGKVIGIIRKVQGMVDKAIDRVIKAVVVPVANRVKKLMAKVKGFAKKAGGKLKATFGKKAGATTGKKGGKKPGKGAKDEKPDEKVMHARKLKAAQQAVALMKSKKATIGSVQSKLPSIARVNKVAGVKIEPAGKKWIATAWASAGVSATDDMLKVGPLNLRTVNRKGEVVFRELGRATFSGTTRKDLARDDETRMKQGSAAGKDPLELRYADWRGSILSAMSNVEAKDGAPATKSERKSWNDFRALVNRGTAIEVRKIGPAILGGKSSQTKTIAAMLIVDRVADKTTGKLAGEDQGAWGRRHIVSHHDVAEHYNSVFPPMTLKEAVQALKTLSVPEVSEEHQPIIGAIHAKHKEFFNKVENLWVGGQRENASYGEALDPPPGWTAAQAAKHIKQIAEAYAVKGHAFNVTIRVTEGTSPQSTKSVNVAGLSENKLAAKL